jgi:ATP phosphoribosyltransferase regulatory subunit
MTFPIPPGTRDVLPDEMRELRALMDGLRSSLQQAGYGEVRTPTVEYEDVLRQGDARSAARAGACSTLRETWWCSAPT